MQAVVPDGREEEREPSRRIGTHIGMGVIGYGAERIERSEHWRFVEIEESNHAEADEEQFDRIADIALHRVELRNMMMWGVRRPEPGIVMHQTVHPVLAEFDQQHHKRNLDQKWQLREPRGGDAQCFLGLLERAIGERVGDLGNGGDTEQDIKAVGQKFPIGNAPAFVPFIDPFHQLNKGQHDNAHDCERPHIVDPCRRRKCPECHDGGKRHWRQ